MDVGISGLRTCLHIALSNCLYSLFLKDDLVSQRVNGVEWGRGEVT